ncbi:cache domain-containing protein [Poseidonibacter lekithochrous]|uniref:sensor histidine kinase n=1 Tax=Poseidonibacter lekithochrous TaxID=1904463 RepID=UPI0008FC7219|nr:cache domain-containing protein [Poseidonibacter lekithochrous]QKJ22620.1 Cache sensor-containing signal transduction histidine kinase [Poseidonibacter lekithochrous]
MIFQNEKQLLQIIKYTPSIFVLTISIIILTIQFVENNRTFEIEKEKIRTEFNIRNKNRIKQETNEIYNFIKKEQQSTKKELKESLTSAVDNAYAIANTIYQNNLDKDPVFIKKLIVDALRNIRFNKNRGYFFIYENTGENILLPHNPEREGENFWNHQDSKGAYVIQDMVNLLKNTEESFYQWYWFNPTKPDKQKTKIGLVRNFKPFNWFIGTGEYIEEYEVETKEKILDYIDNINSNRNDYIFIIDFDLIYISHIRKDYIGKNAIKINDTVETKKVINNLLKIAKKGEGYYTYIQNKKPGNDLPTKKVSYIKGLDSWSWMIGTGFYEDDMNTAIIQKRKELDKKFELYVYKSLEVTGLITIVLLILSIYFSRILQKKFIRYKSEIKAHIDKNTKQQNIMAQKTKMAAMGEMIGNIAHQWRQPLSTITATATGLKIQKEMNVLNDDFLIEGLSGINNTAQYLSKTIDDFRNFFKTNKKETDFTIEDVINKSLSLCRSELYNLDIKIIKNIGDITITNYENEFIQVLINIIRNAKDELTKKDQNSKKLIFIEVKEDNKYVKIMIKDNAGGIPKSLKNRIFEPYFTTKHQSQGTGVGLYMCKEIIEKNMGGFLEVENCEYKYIYESYIGACFEIRLPIN